MLKNKFKLLTFFIVVVLVFTFSTVMAVDADNTAVTENTSDNNTATDTATTESGDGSHALAGDTSINDNNFKKYDVYLTGDEVTIDYIVDGNLFVMANKVTINSQIGGDAFILADNLTIGESGYIFSNLFTICNDITINGIVYDLYSLSKNTTINGYVYRDIRASSDNMNILGTVGRNAYLNCSNIKFKEEVKVKATNNDTNVTDSNQTTNTNVNTTENTEQNTQTQNVDTNTTTDANSNEEGTTIVVGTITGDLNYSSKKEVSVPDGVVAGKVNFEQIKDLNKPSMNNLILNLGTFVFTVIAIWLVCLWLTPKFIKNTSNLIKKKALPIIGLGILTPIALIILSILLFVLGVTSTLGLLLIIALFALLAISTSIFVITIANIICSKLKVAKTKNTFGILVITSIVLWLIALIPFIGPIFSLIAMLLGLGIIAYSLLFKNKLSTVNEEVKAETK